MALHLHRNSQKRIIEPGKTYFITTNTYQGFPYFKNEILAWLFIAQLKLAKILKGFELYAFCVLYDHVHLMVRPNEKFDITKIMFTLKKQFSHSANRVMGYTPMKSQLISVGEGVQTFARLQGKMFDYIGRLKIKFSHLPQCQKEVPPFKWQSSYIDHIIRNQKDFDNHYEYTVQNFKKETSKKYNYPDDYRFTSENFPEMIDSWY